MKNSFDICDYQQTIQSLALYNRSSNQDVDDYIIRKRKAELRKLVRKVIKNELSEFDRQLVILHWYKNLSKQEIAGITGLDRSTIFRHFEKINETIYEKLKYAIEYRFGNDFASNAEILIKDEIKTQSILNNLVTIGDRVKALREKNFLSVEDVAEMTGISIKRLSLIEKNGKEISMIELSKLASFYKVSTDSIVFGDRTGTKFLN